MVLVSLLYNYYFVLFTSEKRVRINEEDLTKLTSLGF